MPKHHEWFEGLLVGVVLTVIGLGFAKMFYEAAIQLMGR